MLIQFGHNDGGPIDSERARASLNGVGAGTREDTIAGQNPETVHTYGWYLQQYVAEARARGAPPILPSPVPRNLWTPEGQVVRATRDYGHWAAEVARGAGVSFVDLNALVADQYDRMGQFQVGRDCFTAADHTHSTREGAQVNARCVAAGLNALPDQPLAAAILDRPPAAQ